jgi:DNA-binding LacI/PurR family transcriptional regulator
MRARKVPLYKQVVRKLEQSIANGDYEENCAMPSDIDLSRELKVSVDTVRKAYSDLVKRGWVKRVRKKGTVLLSTSKRHRIEKIGVILVAPIPPYQLLLRGVEKVMGERGTGLFMRWNGDNEASNQEAIMSALKNDSQGIIVQPPFPSSFEFLRGLTAEGFPLVLVLVGDPRIHSVIPDDHQAGYLVGEHFARKGFRRVAAVIRDGFIGRERLHGFREALAKHGIELLPNGVIPIEYADANNQMLTDLGRREAEAILKLPDLPEAIFVFNDSHAIALHYWLQKYKISVPDDIALAAVDNLGKDFSPLSLTSVDIGLTSIGSRAAELLIAQIENPHHLVVQEKIAPRLIVGASTAKGMDKQAIINLH